MPRAKKEIPDGECEACSKDRSQVISDDDTGFEEDSQSGKVRCLACKGNWVLKGSAQRHLLGAGHLSTVAAASDSRQQAEENTQRLQQPYYNSSSAYINPSSSVTAPELRVGIFDAAAYDDMPGLVPLDDDEYHASSPLIPVGILPATLDDPDVERELLRRQVEILLMQAEQVDEFSEADFANDSTITNIVEQFRLLGTISDQSFVVLSH